MRNTAALQRDKPEAERAAIEILVPEEAKETLAAHYLWPIAFLALHTGMRRGELLGLQWADVGLDKAELRVTRRLEQTKAGLRLKAPKIASGSRPIALDADAVDMLRKHKLETLQQRMACGVGGKLDDVPVFSCLGDLIPPDKVSRDWARNAKVKATFHSLRHSHASLGPNRGIDIITMSRRLGHSKPSITLDVTATPSRAATKGRQP